MKDINDKSPFPLHEQICYITALLKFQTRKGDKKIIELGNVADCLIDVETRSN